MNFQKPNLDILKFQKSIIIMKNLMYIFILELHR